MQSSSCDFPASTSPGSSPRPSKTRSENQSDLCRHLQSFSAGSHLCPFDVHKFRKVEMKEQVKSLHVVLSPDRRSLETPSDDQFCQAFAVQERTTLLRAINIGGRSSFHESDNYDESSHDTSDTSVTSQDDSNDSTKSNDFIVPHTDPSMSLFGIGQWVDERSSSESASAAWHNPNVLLQHASVLRAASITMKPHVEEAMNCFRASFYGARGAAEQHCYIVDHH